MIGNWQFPCEYWYFDAKTYKKSKARFKIKIQNSKSNNLNLPKEDLEDRNYFEKCELLYSSLALLSRCFQHRVEILFKKILLAPLAIFGKVAHYSIRMKFQVCGSPHVHSFIWILNPPKINNGTTGTHIKFIDQVTHVDLSSHIDDPSLYELVKLYQVHEHPKSCIKYENKSCRYGFGRFLQKDQLSPLEDNIKDIEQFSIIIKTRKCTE